MAIIEIRGGPITRKYLEKKSKFDLITEYLHLLEVVQEAETAAFAEKAKQEPPPIDVEAITSIAWEVFFSSNKPAPYNQMKDVIHHLASKYDFVPKNGDK